MTMSLRRHYKSWSKCHGNERLKSKAFRRLRKTDIEGADVTCWGRLFQVREAARGLPLLSIRGLGERRISSQCSEVEDRSPAKNGFCTF